MRRSTVPTSSSFEAEKVGERSDQLIRALRTQQTLPMPAEVETRRNAVRTYGAENEGVVQEQVRVIREQLTTLQFELNTQETTDVLLRHLAVSTLLLKAETLYRLIFGSKSGC